MSTSTRLTEKWINRGLWVIAFAFAGFFIGLGSLIVEDLPKVQTYPKIEDYIELPQYNELKTIIVQKEKSLLTLQSDVASENTKLDALNRNYRNAKENFNNRIDTRHSTQDASQNSDVLKITKDLETQLDNIKSQDQRIQTKNSEIKKLETEIQSDREKIQNIEKKANEQVNQAIRWNEIKVFLYRLALTLPLLLIAMWLFIKKRKTQQWPFVWGFTFFALFAFFVELVPYMPSYGGYIRYIVGIVLTYFIGRYSIKALQNYLEAQKKAELQPSNILKEKMNYDLAQQRISKNICPGCERSVDLKDESKNFCIHCGTCLFNQCQSCHSRKNAFAKYCHSCGVIG